MNALAAFPINSKWPAQHPERLQLYSLPTPNGVKVSIMLEELGLPYEAHKVSFDTQDQLSPEFLSLNPNNKIPAIIDPNGPSGQPLALFESGAILIYLAEKTSQLLSEDPATGSLNAGVAQWLLAEGLAPNRYVVSQGTAIGRAGRIHIERQGDEIWVGGAVALCIEGRLQL